MRLVRPSVTLALLVAATAVAAIAVAAPAAAGQHVPTLAEEAVPGRYR